MNGTRLGNTELLPGRFLGGSYGYSTLFRVLGKLRVTPSTARAIIKKQAEGKPSSGYRTVQSFRPTILKEENR